MLAPSSWLPLCQRLKWRLSAATAVSSSLASGHQRQLPEHYRAYFGEATHKHKTIGEFVNYCCTSCPGRAPGGTLSALWGARARAIIHVCVVLQWWPSRESASTMATVKGFNARQMQAYANSVASSLSEVASSCEVARSAGSRRQRKVTTFRVFCALLEAFVYSRRRSLSDKRIQSHCESKLASAKKCAQCL